MNKNAKQTVLTAVVTVGLLIPVIMKIIPAFNVKLDTFDSVETIAEFVFLILSYGIGAAVSGLLFSKIHVKKYIACIGSLALVILCAIVLPPVFIAIMNFLFRMLGIIGLALAFLIAILSTYLTTGGVFLFLSVMFNGTITVCEKILGLSWIWRVFRIKG